MIQEQLRQKVYFLLKAYQGAYEYHPAAPLSVDVNPFQLSLNIGYDRPTVMRIMQELVSERYVSSGAGYQMLMITDKGLRFLQELQKKSAIMKQSEKMDLILKRLYELRADGLYYSVKDILLYQGIEAGFDEIFRLAKKLEQEGYIRIMAQHQDVNGLITSEGIDRVEQETFSPPEALTVNNYYSVSHSPNANLVAHSHNVSISQEIDTAQKTVNEIRERAKSDPTVTKELLQEILDCLSEIEIGLKQKTKPKFAIKALLDITGGISSIASLGITLAQLAHALPAA